MGSIANPTRLSAAIVLALHCGLAAGPAQAATITVDDQCSLIDAIQAANSDQVVGNCSAGAGADEIQVLESNSVLALSTPFGQSSITPNVSIALPTIASDITIEGNGLTIAADTLVNRFRVIDVTRGAALTLRDTTVTGGNVRADLNSRDFAGGLLAIGAQVTMDNVRFIKNVEAALLVDSTVTIENSVFRDNTFDLDNPSALSVRRSSLVMNNTSIVNNRRRTPRLYEEFADYILGSPAVELAQSDVTISNSTISGNEGEGGLAVDFFTYTKTFSNSPISKGGRVVTITSSTITDNTGTGFGGIEIDGGRDAGVVNVRGSIIVGNRSILSSERRNIDVRRVNPVVNTAHNVIGEGGSAGVTGVELAETDRITSAQPSALFYPLTESNGQFLHPLKNHVDVVDRAPKDCFGLVSDQEGSPRALDGDGDGEARCDTGAFEKSADIVVNANCGLVDAMIAANTDSTVGNCTAGLGADVIVLPSNSVQTLATVDATMADEPFGLPLVSSAIILNGNGSTIQRDSSAPEFGLLGIEPGGDLLIRDSVLRGGAGTFAGVFSNRGNLGLQGTTIAEMDGIAFLNILAAKTFIDRSTIRDNQLRDGAAISSNGAAGVDSVDIQASTFANNTGGSGAALALVNNRFARLSHSTLSGNSSFGDSPFVVTGPAQIENVTATGNTGTVSGGGVITTFPLNDAFPQGVVVTRSIFSGNRLHDQPTAVGGEPTSAPELFRTEQDGAGVFSFTNVFGELGVDGIAGFDRDGPSFFPVAPLPSLVPVGSTSEVIGSLQNNGGPTQTHNLVIDSVAIDVLPREYRLPAIPDQCTNPLDQRQRPKPFDGDGDGQPACDLGAVEFGSFDPNAPMFADSFESN